MKNVYEMTKKEYLDSVYEGLSEHRQEVWQEQLKNPDRWIWPSFETEIAKHKVAIIDAIWIGINVEQNVLKDYPNIIERFSKEIEENKIKPAMEVTNLMIMKAINTSKKYNDQEVIEIWRNMEDVLTDINNEIIESDYFIWKKGTLISEIWGWFNNNYSKGLKELWLDAL